MAVLASRCCGNRRRYHATVPLITLRRTLNLAVEFLPRIKEGKVSGITLIREGNSISQNRYIYDNHFRKFFGIDERNISTSWRGINETRRCSFLRFLPPSMENRAKSSSDNDAFSSIYARFGQSIDTRRFFPFLLARNATVIFVTARNLISTNGDDDDDDDD